MTPLPGAPAPGADDLERRLAAALNPELSGHLVADAAALRAHARAGSRRIRRRRRVAAGALAVVVLGGLGALALPRHQDPSPVPLPVATPTVTPTGVTTQPTPSGTPTGTPSLQVTSTPPSNSVSPTHTPTATGTASGTHGARTTVAQTGASRPSRTTTSAIEAPAAPVTVGDWMSVADTTGYTTDSTGSLTLQGTEVSINTTDGSCRGVAWIGGDGFAIGRYWQFDRASGYAGETVTVWEKGRGREALGRVSACYSMAPSQLERTADRYIEAMVFDDDVDVSKARRVHAYAVASDSLIALDVSLIGTAAEVHAQADDLLDGVVARLQAKGVG